MTWRCHPTVLQSTVKQMLVHERGPKNGDRNVTDRRSLAARITDVKTFIHLRSYVMKTAR